MVFDTIPPIEKEANRKIKCMWCSNPIEAGNDYMVRSIKTDKGVMKGNLHLGCSSAIDASPVDLIKQGWVSGENGCGRALE